MRLCLDPLLYFLFAEDDEPGMPEVPADEALTDPTTASEEEPRDSGVDPESPPGKTSLLLTFCFPLLILLTFLLFFFCQLIRQRILTTLSHPWT